MEYGAIMFNVASLEGAQFSDIWIHREISRAFETLLSKYCFSRHGLGDSRNIVLSFITFLVSLYHYL